MRNLVEFIILKYMFYISRNIYYDSYLYFIYMYNLNLSIILSLVRLTMHKDILYIRLYIYILYI